MLRLTLQMFPNNVEGYYNPTTVNYTLTASYWLFLFDCDLNDY